MFSGEISPFDLVRMDADDLAHKDLLEKRKKLKEDSFNARRSDWDIVNLIDKRKEGLYTCFKCKGKQTTYTQLQTRRADEGMTTYVKCIKCGNSWRV